MWGGKGGGRVYVCMCVHMHVCVCVHIDIYVCVTVYMCMRVDV